MANSNVASAILATELRIRRKSIYACAIYAILLLETRDGVFGITRPTTTVSITVGMDR